MYTDDDQFSDSDSESPCPPQIEKRQYHNLLERNRRNILKYSFSKLKNAIPSFQRKNSRASRAKILKRSIDFIHRSKLKKPARDQDVKELKTDNKLLEEQIQAMETAKDSADLNSLQALLKKISETEFKEHQEEPSDSEEDDDDSDDATGEMEENDPEAAYSEDDYDDSANKGAKNNWSSEDWDDMDEVEENPEPQLSWSVSVTETESESDDSSYSEDTTD